MRRKGKLPFRIFPRLRLQDWHVVCFILAGFFNAFVFALDKDTRARLSPHELKARLNIIIIMTFCSFLGTLSISCLSPWFFLFEYAAYPFVSFSFKILPPAWFFLSKYCLPQRLFSLLKYCLPMRFFRPRGRHFDSYAHIEDSTNARRKQPRGQRW